MAGYHKPVDINNLLINLHYQYPYYVSNFIKIGYTYQNRDLNAIKLGDLKSNNKKAEILFTALHHAREPLGLNMLLQIFLTKLYDLIHRGQRPDLFDTNEIYFIPIVNLDTYELIASRYGKNNWDKYKML